MTSGNDRLLGENIGYLIDIGRKSRSDLAAAMGVTVQAIGQLIRGESKGLKPLNLVKAAKLLGFSVEELVTRDLRGSHSLAEPAAVYGVVPPGSAEPELDILEECIKTMFEAALSRKHRPSSGKFARDCLLLYEMSREGDATTIVKSAGRLLSDES